MLTSRPLDNLALHVGRGLIAGAVGTATMTAFQLLKNALTSGSSSSTPAKAVEKTLGVEPTSERAETRLTNLTHWAYGTGWGVARGLLDTAGMRGWPATATHLATVWGTALVMLPSLDLAPPPYRWSAKTLGSDLLQHTIYAVAVGTTYDALARFRP